MYLSSQKVYMGGISIKINWYKEYEEMKKGYVSFLRKPA